MNLFCKVPKKSLYIHIGTLLKPYFGTSNNIKIFSTIFEFLYFPVQYISTEYDVFSGLANSLTEN